MSKSIMRGAAAAAALLISAALASPVAATPVTRGQLSVFLAVALGLHFPN